MSQAAWSAQSELFFRLLLKNTVRRPHLAVYPNFWIALNRAHKLNPKRNNAPTCEFSTENVHSNTWATLNVYVGQYALQEPTSNAHHVMAPPFMTGLNFILKEIYPYNASRLSHLDACSSMEHASSIICTHNTPDVTHEVGHT